MLLSEAKHVTIYDMCKRLGEIVLDIRPAFDVRYEHGKVPGSTTHYANDYFKLTFTPNAETGWSILEFYRTPKRQTITINSSNTGIFEKRYTVLTLDQLEQLLPYLKEAMLYYAKWRWYYSILKDINASDVVNERAKFQQAAKILQDQLLVVQM